MLTKMLKKDTHYLYRLTCDVEGCRTTLEDDYPSNDCAMGFFRDAQRKYEWEIRENNDVCALHALGEKKEGE